MEMELSPGCRRRRSSRLLLGVAGGGADRVSALPDDLLHLILDRLECAAAAARTGVLSRRWREGLWTHISEIVFRDVPFRSLHAAVGRFSPGVSLLEIRVPEQSTRALPEDWADSADVDSLLRAAARLAPEEFVFALPFGSIASSIDANLPCFRRTTSIVLDSIFFFLNLPAGVEFPALETLSLSGCIVDLNSLLSRCPRLRVLRLKVIGIWVEDGDLTVHSASLQELVVVTENTWIRRVDIVAPMLKQLTTSLCSCEELSISISGPLVDKVSWHCRYDQESIGFGLWQLEKIILQKAGRQGHGVELASLQIHAHDDTMFFPDVPNFAKEIKNHIVAEFSVLELHLATMGHVFGAFVVHVLGVSQIRCATRRLKVFISRSRKKEECSTDCPCEPTNWRTQIIALTSLEEVEINGFQGENHEFDFLKLIFRSAPTLKRMVVKLSNEDSPSNDGWRRRKIYDIFRAYSFCGLLHLS